MDSDPGSFSNYSSAVGGVKALTLLA